MTHPKPHHSADPRYASAAFNPVASRYLSTVLRERGVDVDKLCSGLGFQAEDLERPGFKISYRQASLMIRRSLDETKDSGLGFAVGQRETITSWGLVGFAMMCCETLGEALEFGVDRGYQAAVGVLTTLTLENSEHHLIATAHPMFIDPDIELYLIEETFASFVAVMRQLAGRPLLPVCVELVYQAPPHAALYEATFQCPIRFGAVRNRYVIDDAWLHYPLVTHDASTGLVVRKILEQSVREERERTDVVMTIEGIVRANMAQRLPTFSEIAVKQNTSERTLRRRLANAGFTYDGLVQSVQKARAIELLKHSNLPINQVAEETGFRDTRSFRRAFKRWTEVSPNEARKAENI